MGVAVQPAEVEQLIRHAMSVRALHNVAPRLTQMDPEAPVRGANATDLLAGIFFENLRFGPVDQKLNNFVRERISDILGI